LPNIAFLDLTMPIMDGFEALEKIKEFDNNAKVVIISADIQKLSMDKALQLGAFNFIKKPIDTAKMQQILDKINKLDNQ
jgi:CheY-like chemotaxis protein